MSSFFKAKCGFLWLVWVACCSYLIGAYIFEHKYVVTTPEYHAVTFFLRISGIINIVLSFVGCIFVKCDINHLCCFLTYLFPSLILSPAIAFIGISKASRLVVPSKQYIYAAVNDNLQQYHKLPGWLMYTQNDVDCCGIDSYRDYETKINTSITTLCCSNSTHKPIHKCEANIENKLPLDKWDHDAISMLTENGCFKSIQDATRTLHNSHYVFLVLLIFASLLMCAVYLKNWWDSKVIVGDWSDHSLDVESLTVFEARNDDNIGTPSK